VIVRGAGTADSRLRLLVNERRLLCEREDVHKPLLQRCDLFRGAGLVLSHVVLREHNFLVTAAAVAGVGFLLESAA
jgi:hypothetical protein